MNSLARRLDGALSGGFRALGGDDPLVVEVRRLQAYIEQRRYS